MPKHELYVASEDREAIEAATELIQAEIDDLNARLLELRHRYRAAATAAALLQPGDRVTDRDGQVWQIVRLITSARPAIYYARRVRKNGQPYAGQPQELRGVRIIAKLSDGELSADD